MLKKSLHTKVLTTAMMVVMAALVFQPGLAQAAYIITPASYWKLEKDTPAYVDSVAAKDATCAVGCPDRISGKVLFGQNFTGSDGLDVTDAALFDWDDGDGFTIEFWMRRDNSAFTNNEVVIGRDDLNGTAIHWFVGINGKGGADEGKLLFTLNDILGNGETITGTSLVTDNTWHHVVAVRQGSGDGDQLLLYLDGQPEASTVPGTAYADTGAFASTEPLNIGYLDYNDGAGSLYQYVGDLDEVAIYSSALNEDLILQHATDVRDRGYCNAAPVIGTTAGNTAVENTPYTYAASASDTESDTLTWYLENEPAAMSLSATTGNTVTVSWTPTGGVATSGQVTLMVDDGNGGTDSETIEIAVTNVNDAPVITSPAPATTATEGVQYIHNATATDEDGDSLRWYLENEPAGMVAAPTTGNSVTLTWTPAAGVTTSGSVKLTVDDDNGGKSSQTFTITVQQDSTNNTPEITSSAPTTATENVSYTYAPTATDADGDTLVWSLTSQPAGMTIDTATGSISWTPGTGTTTSGLFTLTVDDQRGGTDSEEITITVSEEAESGGGGSSGSCFIMSLM